eukprot:3077226-Rhodomonas_salina.1
MQNPPTSCSSTLPCKNKEQLDNIAVQRHPSTDETNKQLRAQVELKGTDSGGQGSRDALDTRVGKNALLLSRITSTVTSVLRCDVTRMQCDVMQCEAVQCDAVWCDVM